VGGWIAVQRVGPEGCLAGKEEEEGRSRRPEEEEEGRRGRATSGHEKDRRGHVLGATCNRSRVKAALCNNVDVVYFRRCNFVPFYKK
jgi:hypothetical protein